MRPILKWSAITAFYWLALVFVPSFPAVRGILAIPLVVHDEQSRGDAAYILADGNAFQERLSAAVDLYFMRRVPQIIIINEAKKGAYNFVAGSNWTPTEWALDYLQCRGIPRAQVLVVGPMEKGLFGTLNEARTIAKTLPETVTRLVLITSAPHTRRSLLAFRRALPSEVVVMSYAATAFGKSAEMREPLWLEYVKLLVYGVVA